MKVLRCSWALVVPMFLAGCGEFQLRVYKHSVPSRIPIEIDGVVREENPEDINVRGRSAIWVSASQPNERVSARIELHRVSTLYGDIPVLLRVSESVGLVLISSMDVWCVFESEREGADWILQSTQVSGDVFSIGLPRIAFGVRGRTATALGGRVQVSVPGQGVVVEVKPSERSFALRIMWADAEVAELEVLTGDRSDRRSAQAQGEVVLSPTATRAVRGISGSGEKLWEVTGDFSDTGVVSVYRVEAGW